jgi:hypothetical protein
MLPEYAQIFDQPNLNCFTKILKPLSLGHLFLLDSIKSPVLHEPEKAELQDYLFAVWLCSFFHDEALQKINEEAQESILEEIRTWGEDCGFNRLNTIEQIKNFTEYLKFYLTFPKRWSETQSKKASASPWHLFLVLSLQKELGITEAEGWRMPTNKAFVYFSSIAEGYYGDDKLVTEEDEGFAEKLKVIGKVERMEKAFKEQKEQNER